MPLVRRRPLLRAAAISGGAFYAGKRRAAAQLREADEQARGSSGRAVAIEQLRELGRLRERGVLTEEEFSAQKSKILEA